MNNSSNRGLGIDRERVITTYDELSKRIAFFRHYSDSFNLNICITNKEGKILFGSRSFLYEFQFVKNDVGNIYFHNLIDTTDNFVKYEDVIQLAEKNAWSCRFEFKRNDESKFNSKFNASPIISEEKEFLGLEITISDIKPISGNRISFADLVARTKSVSNPVPDLSILINERGVILGLDILLDSSEDLVDTKVIGKKIESIFSSEVSLIFYHSLNKTRPKGKINSFEFSANIKEQKRRFEARSLRTNKNILHFIIRDITKSKQIEDALKKSERIFRSVWTNSLEGMRLVDSEGKIVRVNNAFCKIVKKSHDDIIGRSFMDLYESSGCKPVEADIKKLRKSFNRKNFKSYFEGKVKLHNGETVYLEISSVLIEVPMIDSFFEDKGYILSIFKDITAKKELEEYILKFKNAIESAAEAFLITDADGKVTYVNKKFKRLYGTDAESLAGGYDSLMFKNLTNLISEPQRLTKEYYSYGINEAHVLSDKGKPKKVIIEESDSPIYNENGEIIGYLSIQRDISEQQKAKELLKVSEKKFRSIWEQSNDGMRLTDSNGIIVAVNYAFCKLVGMTHSELINKPYFVIYQNEGKDQNERISHYRERFYKKEFTRRRISKSIMHNGKILELSVSYSLVEVNQQHKNVLAIFRDMTDYRNAINELNNLEKLAEIGRMSSYLSHEIKNPIISIRNYLEIIFNKEDLSEKTQSTLMLIKDEVVRLEKLLKDVLQYSRQFNFIEVHINLSKLVEHVCLLLKPKLDKYNITIHNNLADITITGDYQSLQSAFVNLIDNAIDAIDSSGIIEFSAAINNGNCSIFIKDNGCGIKDLDKLFKPFFSTKSSGTGLGMAIVKKIMELHKGNIKVISSNPGETIFELTFPLKEHYGQNINN